MYINFGLSICLYLHVLYIMPDTFIWSAVLVSSCLILAVEEHWFSLILHLSHQSILDETGINCNVTQFSYCALVLRNIREVRIEGTRTLYTILFQSFIANLINAKCLLYNLITVYFILIYLLMSAKYNTLSVRILT
jgi:hypothetical protein